MVIRLNRRQLLKASAVTASAVATGLPLTFLATSAAAAYTVPQKMNWWYAARFGMFIHFGSYSYLGHGEWADAPTFSLSEGRVGIPTGAPLLRENGVCHFGIL